VASDLLGGCLGTVEYSEAKSDMPLVEVQKDASVRVVVALVVYKICKLSEARWKGDCDLLLLEVGGGQLCV
jgi:hypothetical protein